MYKRFKMFKSTPLESHRGQNVPRGFVVVRPGWAESPETPERRAASSQADTGDRVVHGSASEGLLGSRQEGSGWNGAEKKSRRSSAVRWMRPAFPLPRGNLGSEPVQQHKRREADPSWRMETVCLLGPRWRDWTSRTEDSKVTRFIQWTQMDIKIWIYSKTKNWIGGFHTDLGFIIKKICLKLQNQLRTIKTTYMQCCIYLTLETQDKTNRDIYNFTLEQKKFLYTVLYLWKINTSSYTT